MNERRLAAAAPNDRPRTNSSSAHVDSGAATADDASSARTVTAIGLLALEALLVSPAYVAMRLWSPTARFAVTKTAWPFASSATTPIAVPPSVNVTFPEGTAAIKAFALPLGVGELPVTVAVSVRFCVAVTGFGVAVRLVLVLVVAAAAGSKTSKLLVALDGR